MKMLYKINVQVLIESDSDLKEALKRELRSASASIAYGIQYQSGFRKIESHWDINESIRIQEN